jgi:hypothetical protein
VKPEVHLQKLNLSSRECAVMLGSVALFRRLRHHGWLRPLQESRPGRSSLYPYSRLEAVQERLERGEFPPPLPCEARNQPAIFPSSATQAVLPRNPEDIPRRTIDFKKSQLA